MNPKNQTKHSLEMQNNYQTIYLIKLQKLINSLTDAEFEQCMIEIIKEFGKDYIFIYFSLHSSKLKNQSKEFYERISNIIERLELGGSRRFRHCLNDMPSTIIATIASYFSQKDYVALSQCSRNLYIGCNENVTLKALDLSDCPITEHLRMSLVSYRYQSVQMISLKLIVMKTLFSEIKFHAEDKVLLPNIETLTLYGSGIIDIQDWKDQRVIRLNNIKTLTLANQEIPDWTRSHQSIHIQRLWILLPILDELNIDVHVDVFDDFNYTLPIKSLTTLTINVVQAKLSAILLRACRQSLKKLKIHDQYNVKNPLSDGSNEVAVYPQLEMLHVTGITLETIPYIIKGASNLKDISFSIVDWCRLRDGGMPQKKWPLVIKQFISLPKVTVLTIYCEYSYGSYITEGIISGIRNNPFKQLQILVELMLPRRSKEGNLCYIFDLMSELRSEYFKYNKVSIQFDAWHATETDIEEYTAYYKVFEDPLFKMMRNDHYKLSIKWGSN